MKQKINREELSDKFREITESLGFEFVEVQFEQSRRGLLLRLYIDAAGGVGHDECEGVSRAVASFLDEADENGVPLVDEAYFLEVSSPGLERPLFTKEQYARFIGRRAIVKTKAKKQITGDIAACDDDGVELTCLDGSAERLSFTDIAGANLVFVLEKGEKKKHNKKK